jgi:hypothetical protein
VSSSPASIKAMYERHLSRVGEQVTIRRYTGSGLNRPRFDAEARARVEDYVPSELVGTIQQGDRRVVLYADDLLQSQFAMPVTANDKIIVRGRELSIVAVDDSTRRLQGQLIALEIQARG